MWDKKIPGFEQRRHAFIALIATHPYSHVIEWIIDHIGVSKEAGADYTQPRWTSQQWTEEMYELDCGELGMDEVLRIRHAISAADMLTAVGEGGHVRCVEYNARKIYEETGEHDTKELRRRVRAIHVAKHMRIFTWVHLRTRATQTMFENGVRRLVGAYNRWCAVCNADTNELIIM